MNIQVKKKVIIDFLFILIVIAVAYFVMKYAIAWFLPFIIGLIIALIVQKPVEILTKKTHISRTFWSIVAVALFFALLLALVVFPIVSIYNGMGAFVNWAVKQMPAIKEEINALGDGLDHIISRLPSDIAKPLMNYPDKLLEGATDILTRFASTLAKGIITYFPATLLTTTITIVASCFTTVYYDKIKNFFLYQFNEKNQQLMIKVKGILIENVLKMLGGYILILFITFLELFLGMAVIGVPYAGIVALLIALFDILPVVGTGTVLIPWFLIDMAIGKTGQGIGMLIIYLVITVVRNIIEPKIIGERIGLFPLVTLISMYIGLQLFGIFGLILLPLAIVVITQLQKAGIIKIWKMPESPEKTQNKEQGEGLFSKIKNRFKSECKKTDK